LGAIAACSSSSATDGGNGTSDASAADGTSASDARAMNGDASGPRDDAASANDAGASQGIDAGGTIGIACHGTTCTAGTYTCCQAQAGGAFTCEPIANSPNTCQADTAKDCDDWADCASMGLVCCGRVTGDGEGFFASTCTTTQQCGMTAPMTAVVCAASAPNACPNDAPCVVPDGGKAAFCMALF
jgi:hypothetical protein